MKAIQFFKNKIQKHPGFCRILILIIAAISSFTVSLIKISNFTIVHDWGYFNGLSYVVRSSVLHYKTFPIHNPYLLGGIDILANPQSRVFSPFVIFDVLFSAPYANLFALVTLGVIGALGFYRLIVYLGVSKNIALLGSIIFIHASWFALHFSEGHIVFGSFQLLGLAFYFILRLQERDYKIYYALLNAFYFLDGAIYAFVFTNLLLVLSIILQIHGLSIIKFLKSLYVQWKTVLVGLFLFISIAGAKLIPFLLLNGSRQPILEFVTLGVKPLFHCFFDPFQYVYKPIGQPIPFRFHEIGAYIGIPGALIVILFLARRGIKNHIGYLAIAVFFFWIGSGRLPKINPWLIFQKIPVLNNAHVQPRMFIFVYLMFAILLCFSLDAFRKTLKPIVFYSIVCLLLIESVFVSSYPFYKIYQRDDKICKTALFSGFIENNTIEKTVVDASDVWGFDFMSYFRKNTGAKFANEPSLVRGDIKTIEDDGYKGEIYLTKGSGTVTLDLYTPGKIKLSYHLGSLSEIQLNTNYLLGWKTNNHNLELFQKDGLLTIKPQNLSGNAEILYRPNYLYIIFPLYFLGLLLTLYLFLSKRYGAGKI